MIGDVDVPSQSEAFWQRPLGEDGYRARLLAKVVDSFATHND